MVFWGIYLVYVFGSVFFYLQLFVRPTGSIITTNKKRNVSVKIGDVVSFAIIASKRLQGKFVHRITRVRHDLLWRDVVNSYFGNKAKL